MYLRTRKQITDLDDEFATNDCWECGEKNLLVTICLGKDSKDSKSLKEITGTTFVCKACLKAALERICLLNIKTALEMI